MAKALDGMYFTGGTLLPSPHSAVWPLSSLSPSPSPLLPVSTPPLAALLCCVLTVGEHSLADVLGLPSERNDHTGDVAVREDLADIVEVRDRALPITTKQKRATAPTPEG